MTTRSTTISLAVFCLALLTEARGLDLLAPATPTASLGSIVNGVATFEFKDVPAGGMTGNILIEINGSISTFPYDVGPGGKVKITLPPGSDGDPNASYTVLGDGYGTIGMGGLF